jgi:hypothetical protein
MAPSADVGIISASHPVPTLVTISISTYAFDVRRVFHWTNQTVIHPASLAHFEAHSMMPLLPPVMTMAPASASNRPISYAAP